MGRRERLRALAAVCLPALLVAVHQPATAGQASGTQPAIRVDSLEPAKAAIRIKNYGAAEQLLTEQAARNDADAQYLLGTLLLADLLREPDRERAQAMFESAARNGQARAALALAAMAANGDPRDAEAARRWLSRAAELGDPEARDMLQRGVLPLEFRVQDSLADEESRRIAMWRAARRDDVATLSLLATAERVDAVDQFARTALHHAAEVGAVGAVELLLARGATVEASDDYGVTPLMLACSAEAPGACNILLRANASVAAADHAGNTALAYALRSGRVQAAHELEAAGSAPVRRSASTSAGPVNELPRAATDAYAGWPDVVVAASRKDPERLRGLLDQGADPNAAAPGGQTALMAAIAAGSSGTAALLLDAGADVSRADAQGDMPLGVAVRDGNATLIKLLLRHGADANAHAAGQRPPLLVAVARSDQAAVRLLLEAGADANSSDPTGTTPLMFASARDDSEIAVALLAAGALPSATDSSARSALWLAACGDATATAAVLIKAGAAVDAADRDGVTPLSCAAARGHTAMVDRLAAAGASMASRTRAGDTPLMLAAAAGQASAVRRLLVGGSDVNAQNRLGDTALILASLTGSDETVHALLDAGASRKLRNRDGVAAADAARARNFNGIVAMLEK
jgi:ankyrin repeat protein